MLTLALPTGRVQSDCLEILAGAGLPTERLRNAGRNLVIREEKFQYLLSKPSDIPMLVCQGAADLALAGSDVTEEAGLELAELLDTGRGRCFMAIAGPKELAERFRQHESELMGLRIATKYLNTAERAFASRGVQVRLLHLHGSVELAPALGLSDCILDIVQTGGTLVANGLEIIEKTADVSLRLIGNPGALQLRWEDLSDVVLALRAFVEREGEIS